MVKKPLDKNSENLKDYINNGGITLVLGAGVSIGSGVLSWNELTDKIFDERGKFNASKILKNSGISLAAIEQSPSSLTINNQIKLEIAGIVNDKKCFRKKDDKFYEYLKNILYAEVCCPKRFEKNITLDALAEIVLRTSKNISKNPSIKRIITFNIDDLLERAVLEKEENNIDKFKLKIVSHYFQNINVKTKKLLPVYHLHGFLPSEELLKIFPKYKFKETMQSLVLGDDEYWGIVSNPNSLANTIMMTALHDSHCVFIGCSMTDQNIARWLALRMLEVKDEKQKYLTHSQNKNKIKRNDYYMNLNSHYWIDGKADSLRAAWLKLRGVHTIDAKDNKLVGEKLKEIFGIRKQANRRNIK